MPTKIIRLRDAGNSFKVHLNKRVLKKLQWNELDRIQINYSHDIITIINLSLRFNIEELEDEVSE